MCAKHVLAASIVMQRLHSPCPSRISLRDMDGDNVSSC